ncbi:hypothetical protein FRC03_005818 [Tulasnella sp. 419]|nr:hypothetical protein FRC02_003274 [Tulasnella sp. 418]KAG8940062.1 hypothetical protein FRC03_005818 [Tulasnella sp. 419]
MRAPVLISLTGLVACVDISSAAPMIHSETHRALEPRGLTDILRQTGDDISRWVGNHLGFGKSSPGNVVAALGDDTARLSSVDNAVGSSAGSGNRGEVIWEGFDNAVASGDETVKVVDDRLTGSRKSSDWFSGEYKKLDELDSGSITSMNVGSKGVITWKRVLIGGALITLPIALLALAPAGTAASQAGDTADVDAETYMRNNPTKAHELVNYLRSEKGVDQAEVDKLEKLANEVAPLAQGAKRSLINLD